MPPFLYPDYHGRPHPSRVSLENDPTRSRPVTFISDLPYTPCVCHHHQRERYASPTSSLFLFKQLTAEFKYLAFFISQITF